MGIHLVRHMARVEENVSAEPEGAPIENMGFGWSNNFGKGFGRDTITSGIEGPGLQILLNGIMDILICS